MKFIKKVSFMVMSTALLSTVMVGCGSKVDVDQELVDSAAGAIVISGYTQVSSNLTAPRYVTKDGEKLEINWTEDSDSVEILDFDENTKKIVFTRPGVGAEAVAYSLTGTVELNGKTASKEISGYIMPYTSEVVSYSTISDIRSAWDGQTLTKTDTIKFIGTIDNILSSSYWVTDGENHLLVYKSPTVDKVQLGDQVELTGLFTKYGSIYEFPNTVMVDILKRNQSYAQTAEEITAQGIAALDDSKTPNIQGKLYNVDLMVVVSGNYINFKSPDGNLNFQGYNQPSSANSALTPYSGKVVNIDVVYYSKYTSSGNSARISYVGGTIKEVA